MTGRTILVLGGGVGGLVTANELRRHLGDGDRVVVVERRHDHLFAPSLLWLMVGRRGRDRVERPLADLLAPGVERVEAEVMGLDPASLSVETTEGDLSADAIVVALGAEPDPAAVPGYAEAATDFFSPDGAAAFSRALRDFRGGRVLVVVAALPYKCPAAPYEAALLIDDELRRRGIREASQVEVYSPEPAPMPVAGPALGEAVVALLGGRGIGLHPGSRVERFEPDGREMVLSDGSRVAYDLVAGIAPHRAPAVVRASGLAGANGWIEVDRNSLRTAHEGVYAIGDVTTIPLANGKPLPRAGVFAHAQGLVVARAIAAGSAGRSDERGFDGHGYCWVETGGGRAAFAAGDFYAEPDPRVELHPPGRTWHLGKVLFERAWMGGRLERRLARAGLLVGGRLMGLRAEM